eukprot:3093533-Prymnesium_polylepis.2
MPSPRRAGSAYVPASGTAAWPRWHRACSRCAPPASCLRASPSVGGHEPLRQRLRRARAAATRVLQPHAATASTHGRAHARDGSGPARQTPARA